MALETPHYEVTSKHDGFEVRCYSEMIIATTSVCSDYRGSTSSGFRRIANYIFGGNDKEMKIAMTCLLYTSPSPRDRTRSRMPSSA